MATATVTKTEMTGEQAREVSRQRRGLETRISDLKEDLASQQKTVDEVVLTLRNPTAKTESQVSTERKRLRAIAAELEAAETALTEFNAGHPTDEEIAKLEEEEQAEQKRALHQAQWEAFAANRLKVFEALDQIIDLNIEGERLIRQGVGQMSSMQAMGHLDVFAQYQHKRTTAGYGDGPAAMHSIVDGMRQALLKSRH